MNKDIPYLSVVDMPRKMAGAGAPRQTVFGVLGHTKETGMTRSLGGLVIDTTREKAPQAAQHAKDLAKNSERHIIGRAAATHISGAHYGQVPYAGKYMAPAGVAVS